jgi:ATP adenylyltransferase
MGMTWQEHHERMAFMADVIERAAENPEAALDFNGRMPDVQRLFGSEDGLLLSLRQRWLTALTARLDDDVHAEQARTELAAREPGLRALLDTAARRSVRVRGLQRDEQHIVDPFGEQTVA